MEHKNYRMFRGINTQQIDVYNNPAIETFWYFEPIDYEGDVLWSEGFFTKEDAECAAEYDLSMISSPVNEKV